MKSLVQAYESYERRAVRGEFNLHRPSHNPNPPSLFAILEDNLADFMIQTGFRLKRHTVTGKPMAWSSMTGSQQ